MIHQDREHAGLGLTSMHVMYAKLICTYLPKASNDRGPLGFVTRPMLMLQIRSFLETKACTRDLDDSWREALHVEPKLGLSHRTSLYFQL